MILDCAGCGMEVMYVLRHFVIEPPGVSSFHQDEPGFWVPANSSRLNRFYCPSTKSLHGPDLPPDLTREGLERWLSTAS